MERVVKSPRQQVPLTLGSEPHILGRVEPETGYRSLGMHTGWSDLAFSSGACRVALRVRFRAKRERLKRERLNNFE